MSRGLNKVMLIGNVGADPETRQTTGGASVSNFSLATSRVYYDHAGAKQEKTEWHRIVAWQKLSDICEQYVRKGGRLYVEGSVEYRKWNDAGGNPRTSTEINAREIILLDAPKKAPNGASAGPAAPDEDYPASWDEPGEAAEPEPPPANAGKKRAAKRA